MQKSIPKFVVSLMVLGVFACAEKPEEPPEIKPGLYAQDFSFTEGDDGTLDIEVPVELERDGDGVVRVAYTISRAPATEGGVRLATEGRDFEVATGELVFDTSSGNTQNIPVAIINDTIYESNEQFVITLNSSSGASIIKSTALVTIEENDPPPTASFELVEQNDSTSLFENSGTTVSLKVSLDNASEVDAVVGISRTVENSTTAELIGKTAAFRIDYLFLDENDVVLESASANITIPAEATEKVFKFQPVDDGLAENTESVTFSLEAVSDVLANSGNSLEFSILDDDGLGLVANIPLNDTGMRGAFNNLAEPSDVDNYESLTDEQKTAALAVVTAKLEAQMDHSHGLDFLSAPGDNGFSFTKIKVLGNELSDDTSFAENPWDCVRDNNTGLYWEVKSSEDSLRASNRDFHWYDPDFSTNGGVEGVIGDVSCDIDIKSECNTSYYVADINIKGSKDDEGKSIPLCNMKGWRMPTIDELKSLIDYGKSGGAVYDTNYFAGDTTGISKVWSSTTHAQDPGKAWVMDFRNLLEFTEEKNRHVGFTVRLVNDSQVQKDTP